MFENAPLEVTPPHLAWRTVQIPAGDNLVGWLAGPIITVKVHWKHKSSKPCRELLTKGAVKCYCSTEPQSLRTIGYVPVFTPDKEKCVVIVSETVAHCLLTFAF